MTEELIELSRRGDALEELESIKEELKDVRMKSEMDDSSNQSIDSAIDQLESAIHDEERELTKWTNSLEG